MTLEKLFLELLEAWEADEDRIIGEWSIDFDGDLEELKERKAEWIRRFNAATAGRFAAFAYDNYYPCGGMEACVGTFATKAEARAYLREHYRSSDHTELHDMLKSMAQPRRPK